MYASLCLSLCLVFITLSSTASAGIIYSDAGDKTLKSSSIYSDNIWVGNHEYQEIRGVLAFLLPDFGAVANPFTEADLTMQVYSRSSTGSGGITQHIDLLGLTRTSGTVDIASTDFNGSATSIQTSFATLGTAPYSVSTTESGDTALKDFLNTQYAGGAGANQFVFLRLDRNNVGSVAKYGSYKFTPGGAETNAPALTYAAIPEPASCILISLGTLCLVSHRRR